MGRLDNILILGGGTAGFISALTLKRNLPTANVTVLQSSKLGIIGVGEGSLRQLPEFLHNYLGIDPQRFFAEVEPTWKLGIQFQWGAREKFNYTFSPQVDVTHPHPELPRPIGFYCFEEMRNHCVASVMMDHDLVALRKPDNSMDWFTDFGYHLDNHKFASFLERYSIEQGVQLLDDLVVDVEVTDDGVQALVLESGRRASADLFADCSGFASLLLEKTLKEPFVSYTDSLFCDRAVIGGWARTDEPVHPYTRSETMDAGWSWQIEHLHHINRGYVYASSFVSDEQAERDFRDANSKIDSSKVVKFRSGRFQRAWVKNVVAIGNSAGFVEPLEATAIAAICSSAKALAETIKGTATPTSVDQFNTYNARSWDTIADFLAVHYKFNTQRNTPFWRACHNDVDLRGAKPIVDYYTENGPDALWRLTLEDPVCRFKLDGYYTLLMGQGVRHAKLDDVSTAERAAFRKLQDATLRYGREGYSTDDVYRAVGSDHWQWQAEHFAA